MRDMEVGGRERERGRGGEREGEEEGGREKRRKRERQSGLFTQRFIVRGSVGFSC